MICSRHRLSQVPGRDIQLFKLPQQRRQFFKDHIGDRVPVYLVIVMDQMMAQAGYEFPWYVAVRALYSGDICQACSPIL